MPGKVPKPSERRRGKELIGWAGAFFFCLPGLRSVRSVSFLRFEHQQVTFGFPCKAQTKGSGEGIHRAQSRCNPVPGFAKRSLRGSLPFDPFRPLSMTNPAHGMLTQTGGKTESALQSDALHVSEVPLALVQEKSKGRLLAL